MQIVAGQCMHCDDPPCVRVCPTGASYINEIGGIVEVDNTKCIGCRYCMLACPYDARYFDEEAGVVDKCTFCVHRLDAGETGIRRYLSQPQLHHRLTGRRRHGTS